MVRSDHKAPERAGDPMGVGRYVRFVPGGVGAREPAFYRHINVI